jgi:hypothetical protein
MFVVLDSASQTILVVESLCSVTGNGVLATLFVSVASSEYARQNITPKPNHRITVMFLAEISFLFIASLSKKTF